MLKTSKLDLLIEYIFDPPIIFFQYCCVHHIRYDLNIKKKLQIFPKILIRQKNKIKCLMLKTLPASPTPQTCFLNKQTSGTPLIEMSYLCRSDLCNRCVALTQFMIKAITYSHCT